MRIIVHCAPSDRDLGSRVAAALADSGHEVATPEQAQTEVHPAGVTQAPYHLVLVTRRWSGDGDLVDALAALRAAREPTLLIWWDEDAPSDFLGNGGRAQEMIEVFYACFLPVPDRIQAIVERMRD